MRVNTFGGLAGPGRAAVLAGAALAVLALAPGAARGQANADCQACHGEKDFATERRGRTVSLHVADKAFAASMHGGLECVSCHAALAGKELPYEAPVPKVDCGACHEAETTQHAASLHGKAMKRGDW